MRARSSDKKTFSCECISSVFVAGDTVRLEFIWPGPVPRGGQFFLVKPQRTGVFLGRPLSVAGWKPRIPAAQNDVAERRIQADRRLVSSRYANTNLRLITNRRVYKDRRQSTAGILQFLVTRRGQGSRELVNLRPGEEAELTGPLGNFWAQMDITTHSSRIPHLPGGDSASPIALVGGGVGIAPLLAYIPELRGRFRNSVPFDFYAGFRTGSYGLENVVARSLIIATEDGSQGLKGRIPDFFAPSGYRAVLVCGPEPMLKTVADVCIAGKIPCFLSIEKHMACGVGACLGCTVKTTKGNRRCCTDGPIFRAEEICFEQ